MLNRKRKYGIISFISFFLLITAGIATIITGMHLAFDGPGLGNLTYTNAELYKPIFVFKESNGARKGHSNVAMHKGYLIIPGAPDSGYRGGGFAAFNVSNPKDPKLVISKFDASTQPMREGHTLNFCSSYPGDYAVMQTISGIMFWDWTDIANPKILNNMILPGIQESDYDNGAWWISWQAPYVYVGGSSNGIYIVDAKDPKAPKLLKKVPKSQIGGFNVGSLFAVGNLLITSMQQTGDMAVLDISDPVNPKLLDQHNGPSNYSIMVAGNRIYGAGTDGIAYVYDFSDPTNIKFVNKSAVVGGKGGYISHQDGNIFMGASSNIAKIDVSNDANIKLVSKLSSNISGRDEDFAVVIGNLVFAGNDHDHGSAIFPHQTGKDLKGPSILMVSPKNNAVSQAITSRVGVSMSDNIDLRTVNSKTFIVRAAGGEALPGKYSNTSGILNFFPDAPLTINTTYEVVIPKGGIKDISGNPVEADFISKFSTGTSLSTNLTILINSSGTQEVNKPAVFEAKITGGTGTVNYNWDFGDGTPVVSTTSTKTDHTFKTPGHFVVKLEAKDNSSSQYTSSIQTIYLPSTTVKPAQSSTIIYDEESNTVWNTNPDNNSICLSNANTLAKIKELPSGIHPRNLAKGADGNIWVTNQDDATISVFSTKGEIVKTITLPYGSQPYGIVLSPDKSSVYVTLQATGKLLQLNKLSGEVISSIPVGPHPRAIAVSSDSKRIFVTRFISPEDQGEVIEVDATSFTVKRKIALSIDLGTDSESSGRGVPNYLSGITLTPDGSEAWVTAKKDNVQRGKFKDGLPLTFENTVRSIASRISLSTNKETVANRMDLDNRDSPTAIAFSKMGDYAFIAIQGNNLVEVRDAYKGNTYTAIENSGSAPQGIVLSPDGNRIFIHNFLSRSVSVYDISAIVQSKSNTSTKLGEINTVEKELLAADVIQGKKIFYNASDLKMTRTGYISCASCHVDGGQDGRNWDFTDRGEGMRNTISLMGRAGMGHGRLHWSANFDEIQDFENDIRGSFGGSGFMSDADFLVTAHSLRATKKGKSVELDAIAAYITSLNKFDKSPHRNSNGTLTEDAIKGKAIFQNLGCGSCHAGEDFTDSDKGLLHDVGTMSLASGGRINGPLLGLDVPTLRDVWNTAPYLHDGSAATLYDVIITKNPQDKHGQTSKLTRKEADDLVAYLKQIDVSEPASSTPGINLSLASPLNGSVYDIGSSVPLSITTDLKDISEVIYYANGLEVARTSVSPFTAQWKGAADKNYEINAKALHNKLTTVSAEANIAYQATAGNFFTSVVSKSMLDYKIVRNVTTNMKTRTDREDLLEEVATDFSDAEIIQSPNNDKDATDANFLTIEIAQPGIVYVCYDPRASAVPNWLQAWDKTSIVLKTSDQDLIVYSKNVIPGTLILGGNKATGEIGANSNYMVLGKPGTHLLLPSLAAPLKGSLHTVGTDINLSVTIAPNASDVVKTEYYANNFIIGSSSVGPNFEYKWSNAPSGSADIKAIIFDKNGNQISTDISNIRINGIPNIKPEIELVTPSNNSSYKTNELVKSSVTAVDPEGALARVDYYLNEKFIGSASQSPFTFSFTPSEIGKQTLTAVAVDDKGLCSEPSLGIDLNVSFPLGTTDELSDDAIKIAPVPAHSQFTILNMENTELQQIILTDMKGYQRYCPVQRVSQSELSVDVSGCDPGVYIFEITKGETRIRKKVVVVR